MDSSYLIVNNNVLTQIDNHRTMQALIRALLSVIINCDIQRQNNYESNLKKPIQLIERFNSRSYYYRSIMTNKLKINK